MDKHLTLDTLSPGESGVILSLGGETGAVRRRLIDMGLTPGTRVYLKKTAPFGDPLEVMVRGYELSLRRDDARRIFIGDPPKRPERPSRKAYPDVHSRHRERELAHMREQQARKYDTEEHDRRGMRMALAGNPNSGKTTLFNALTGSNQYVGNWPGVTVEKKEGRAEIDGLSVTIADLPGIYSLSPYSIEEIVARDFIIDERPDAIINIVDATNLERNMYLTIQLLELERPMVVALNFMDEIEKKGDKIDTDILSEKLGVPVIPITARTGENIEVLMRAAHRQIHEGFTVEPDELYDEYTHEIHHNIGELISDSAHSADIPSHWASIKLLEGDSIVEKTLNLAPETRAKVQMLADEYAASSPTGDRETLIADSRYKYIEDITQQALIRGKAPEELTTSDKIDKIVTHKYFALPFFLATMLLVFYITFGPIGSVLSDAAGEFFSERLGGFAEGFLIHLGTADWLIGLCVDGIIAGVGGVLTFLPQIALLFAFLSFLEDTGYMARAAFIMDRLLQRFGLSGKAFIPMLMGFGCTVPAVMGARTMESEKDRRMTIMLVPFMSCSAKLPVYGLISSAFFGKNAGFVVFALYVSGMLTAIISGLLFKGTLFRGKMAPFVLELPPYRLPTAKNLFKHVWDKVRGFIVRAGTTILLVSVVLWALQTFDMRLNMTDNPAESMLGVFGGAIAGIFKPLGFGTWQAAVALLTGFVAKEAVVASLSMFFGFAPTAEAGIVAAALGSTLTSPLAAFSFLIFVLLYVPCVAAVAAIYREMNSFKWMLASVGWQMFCAYFASFLVYQLGGLLGFA